MTPTSDVTEAKRAIREKVVKLASGGALMPAA